jgi:RNA-directed DNA polymerase
MRRAWAGHQCRAHGRKHPPRRYCRERAGRSRAPSWRGPLIGGWARLAGSAHWKYLNNSQLYKAVRSRRSLWRAWNDVSSKARSSKAPQTREEARSFAIDAPRNIERIGRRLRESKFVFLPQKGIVAKKSSGKKRPIVVAPIESRIVQRSILDVLQLIPDLKAILTAGFNFGGVPGPAFGVPNAIYTAIAAMVERPYFIRTDIKSFFDHVPKDRAIRAVLKYSSDTVFDQLFKNAVETEIEDASRHGSDIALFPLFDEGVAQGSCLSPLLCNLLLSDFDQKMNGRGITTIRYIDDILFLGRDAESVFKAFSSAQRLLSDLNLKCYDPRKTEDRSKSEHGQVARGFEFLGCEIKPGSIRPSAMNRKELLTKVNTLLRYSLDLAKNPRLAFKRHATYAETTTLVSQTIQGWANTFGFCTDERLMGSIDAEIGVAVRNYSGVFRKRLRTMSDLDARRAIGVFVIADRVRSVGSKLVRSLADDKLTDAAAPMGGRGAGR